MATRLQRVALESIDPAALPAVLVLADSQTCVLHGLGRRRQRQRAAARDRPGRRDPGGATISPRATPA
jgi:hypothetical protein